MAIFVDDSSGSHEAKFIPFTATSGMNSYVRTAWLADGMKVNRKIFDKTANCKVIPHRTEQAPFIDRYITADANSISIYGAVNTIPSPVGGSYRFDLRLFAPVILNDNNTLNIRNVTVDTPEDLEIYVFDIDASTMAGGADGNWYWKAVISRSGELNFEYRNQTGQSAVLNGLAFKLNGPIMYEGQLDISILNRTVFIDDQKYIWEV